MNERQFRFIIEAPGGRLDRVLVSCLEDFSRSRLQKIIRENGVFVDGVRVKKPAFHLEGGEIVEITIPPIKSGRIKPEPIPIEILFENKDLIVINKPAGMVVHPSAGHTSGTLVHAVLSHAPDIEGVGGERRPGVVHRLDKNTSGVILIAKNDHTHRYLQSQFSRRLVEKTYLALVDGKPPTPQGRIEAPIGRDPHHRKKMAVLPIGKGRKAVSQYTIIESFKEHTLLEVNPITGRTHQVRLHMDFIGCSIVGDRIYGRRRPSIPMDRHFLHAARIMIRIPGRDHQQSFKAPLPEDLKCVLEDLRRM